MTNANGTPSRDGWLARLDLREALSALTKACRSARRHPPGSPLRAASQLELTRAVRKALVHGPFRVRLGPDGPLLPGDAPLPADPVGTRAPAIDLVLTAADAPSLPALVERWAARSPAR